MKYCLGCFLIITLYIPWLVAREVPSPPYIVKQPPTDEVLFQVESSGENDKPFYIECEATGEPAPKYYWVKNGKPFAWQTYDNRISQQLGRGTLSISKPSEVDLGQYQCFAENQYGIATSNSVFMRKAELNSFKPSQPLTLTANEGEPYKLTCQPPDGFPKPIIHWLYFYTNGGLKSINSSRMTVDPEGNLWFTNLTKADTTDNFMYACAATSPFKYEYKYGNRVLLNVISTGISASQNKYEPELQYVTRKNEVAYRGKRAELFCIFGGTPLPQTVWSKNGKIVQSSDRITQGNYGKSLVIKVVDFEDEGTYTCEVSNGVGEAKSYSISLKVLAVPYFTVEPERVNAAEDESVEFLCEAGGVPEPEIKWIHNGQPIAKAPPNPRRKIYKNRIVIERLVKNDTGNYGCNATNSLGYVYKDVYVNVLALAPEITEPPRDRQAVDNQNVNLTCKVLGAPKPNIKWIHNGRELTGGRYEIQQNGDLHINALQFDDAGNYTCFAENKLGNTSASAKLEVKAHTYITDGPEDYEVEAGRPATFRCNVVTDPSLDLEILWLKGDQPIDFEGEPRFLKLSDYSLTITKTIELDSGTYTCLAMTELDEVSARAQLTVQNVPNQPQMLDVECNTKDANIHWKPMGDNGSPILYYIIQYNTSFSPEEWKDAFNDVPAIVMTYNVPMSPWANYSFRVIAVNNIGYSTPSSPSDICSTQPEVPHKNPDNVKGEGDRPDNLVIYWTPMPQIEHNAPGFKYRVYWKKNIPGKDYEFQEIYDYKVDRLTIPNQPSFQEYRIKVIAVNELGEANLSPQEVIGYSGENEPEQAPSNFTLIALKGPTTALMSWNPVTPESVRGHFKGYKIKTWSETSLISKEIQVQGGSSKALVTNFDPYTKNYAQVYVFNGKYNGPPSETLSFDTSEGIPGEIQHLEAIPLGSSAFWLKWEQPDKPNGILTGYNIYYAEVDNNTLKVDQSIPRNPQINDPNIKHAKLAGLKSATKYRIYISATTKVGESKRFFLERSTKPFESVMPGEPSFEYDIFKPGPLISVKVHWIPNEGHPGSHFFVKYRKKGEPEYQITPPEKNEDFLVVPGLDDSVYEFIVVSVEAHTYITDGPEDYEVEARTPATFRCNAVADPSLDLEILWLKGDQPIDFEGEPRFVKSSDYSLTITKTIELDSGTYTCLARTELDEASARAQLTVQDVPNQPQMLGIECNTKDANIHWKPMGDNRSPILYYIIQYNTSFTPEEWKDAFNHVPAADMTYNVPMSPWANYTFRVIAVNNIGYSTPSSHSDVCSTQPEVPHKNPDNVKGEGDRPDNLVIYWTPMPQIEHNAPGFKYRVYWKKNIPGKDYEFQEIYDYKVDRLTIPNQPSFQEYRIKVIAVNELGEANVSPQEVIGYSGENEPEQAPSNFTLIAIQGPTTALMSWNPVTPESVRGHFKGYKIKTWSETSLISKEIQVQGGSSKALVTNFDPYTKNYAQVYVFNGKYNGPPSETLSFDTPEGIPGEMQDLEAIPLGSSAFWLKWEQPDKPNGILTGYNIYYAEVDNTMKVDQPIPRNPQINDSYVKHAKLGGLKPATKYRIYISATTKVGESKRFFIERSTKPVESVMPGEPTFEYVIFKPERTISVRVHWIPNDAHPGSHFFVKYRKKGEPEFQITPPEKNEDFLVVPGLDESVYEFIVVSVDGTFQTESEPQDISPFDGPIIKARENVATAGWFIGMMLAVTFLLLVLIIVCIFKRNRGGKYAVHEREQANGRHDYPDEGGFHEYSQPLDNKSHGRASMSSEPKVGPESDTDSMAEYGDGDTEGMNEDGSFIGQYGRKRGQGETASQGFATLV